MNFLPYLLIAYVLTLPVEFIAGIVKPSADLIAWLKFATLAAFAWHAAVLYTRKRPDPHSAAVLVLAMGVTWFAVLVIHAFRVVTMVPFSFSVVLASIEDSRRTLIQVLGAHGDVYAVAAVALLVVVAVALAALAFRELRKRCLPVLPGRVAAVLCAAALSYLIAADARYVANELVLYPDASLAEYPFSSPDYSKIRVQSGESVFIVQLESVNAAVLFERTPDGRGVIWRTPLPGLRAVLEEGGGVFFPFFWANSQQTHRAQESILCGVSGNVGAPLSGDPVRLQLRTCLPRHLAEAGFKTVFLYSYFDLDFFNFADFHQRAGFQQVVYGPKLMAAGDRKHAWGYDDCTFYERAFDHLAREGLAKRNKVFAYFEVSMNHSPFIGTDKYPQAHPFAHAATGTEHYLNSIAEQDHCLGVFWRRFRALERDDVHLFIVPDHSIPMGPSTGEADFVTWLAYVPPRNRRAEFRSGTVLEPRPSQAQIYPTVLELLGAQRTRQSFAFALAGERRPADYDSCHLLGDPFQRRLSVVRDGEQAEIRLASGEVNSTKDGRLRLGYWEFRDRYYCE